MTTRKNIRISIPEEMGRDFEQAKRKAEDSLACKMTDSQYAASLIRWALEKTKTR